MWSLDLLRRQHRSIVDRANRPVVTGIVSDGEGQGVAIFVGGNDWG